MHLTKLLTKYEEKKLYLKIFSSIAGIVDTTDKDYFANISVNFRKNLFGPNRILSLSGLGKTDLRKKFKAENLVPDSL